MEELVLVNKFFEGILIICRFFFSCKLLGAANFAPRIIVLIFFFRDHSIELLM